MLTLPALPTDNLYKFMALSGLVLCLFSFVYPWAKLLEIELSIADLEAQKAKLKLQGDTVERLLQSLEKKENPTEQEIATVRDLHERSKVTAIDTERARRGIAIQLAYLHRYFWASLVGGILGIVLVNSGFLLWYRRVQRPQDKRSLRNDDA